MAFTDPKAVIEVLDILPGMVAADFGSGAGGYTIPLAERLGNSGKVYALDIRKEMLEVVRSKARSFNLSNVETIWADLETSQGSHLKENSVDIVMISNILFQVENRKRLSDEVFRILKSGGRVVLVEWAEDKKPFGPPLKERVNRKEAEDLFLKTGFVFEKEFNAGEYHYGLVLKKP